jgi:hypothetical protein
VQIRILFVLFVFAQILFVYSPNPFILLVIVVVVPGELINISPASTLQVVVVCCCSISEASMYHKCQGKRPAWRVLSLPPHSRSTNLITKHRSTIAGMNAWLELRLLSLLIIIS